MWDSSSSAFDVVDQRVSVSMPNGKIAQFNAMSDKEQIVAGLREKISSGQVGPDSIQQIVEAACTISGAEGAALAMRQNGSVFCTARAGDMAPALGSELSPESGISGQCLRSGGALRCDDTSTDKRVDAEACRHLGLRSIAVVAVGKTPAVNGILEAFSPTPYAFSDAHMQLLVELSDLVAAAQSTQPNSVELFTIDQLGRRWKLILPVVAVLAACLLVFVGWLSFKRKAPLPHPSKTLAQPVSAALAELAVPREPASNLEKPAPGVHTGHAKTGLRGTIISTSDTIGRKPAAGVKTTPDTDEVGKSPEVPPPAPAQGNSPEEVAAPSASVVPAENKPELAAILTPPSALPARPAMKTSQLTGGIVDRRVNPIYPAEAIKFRLEGQVVVKALVKKDGNVQDITVVEGNLLLARAATDAVSRWHFRPFQLNGQPIEMTTQITLTFKLP